MIDDAKCFELIRQHRWPDGVRCVKCSGASVVRRGHDDTQRHRQRYRCKACDARFDDLTGTVLAGHHQPLRVWVLCLYFMGLNRSNCQIAKELGLNEEDAHVMATHLREGLVAKVSDVVLDGEVEADEVYGIAGHKGNSGTRGSLSERGTLEKEKPPILGLIQRGGQVVLHMLENVQQVTIKPIIENFVTKGAMIYTDEYNIYEQLPVWGYEHNTFCHARGKYARDEDQRFSFCRKELFSGVGM